MKRIVHYFTASLLTLLGLSAAAQNPIVHVHYSENKNLDYMPPGDEYVLSGITFPASIAGMDNMVPDGSGGWWPLKRIQLQVLNNQLTPQWFKTYCTQAEVLAVTGPERTCSTLSISFRCSDAKQTQDGGFILCGNVQTDEEFVGCPGPTYDGAFLLKTDATGMVSWYYRYHDNNAYSLALSSVVEDSATGNFIACGTGSFPGATSTGFIMGTNSSGSLLWSNYAVTPNYANTANVSSSYYEITPYVNNNTRYYALVGLVWEGIQYGGGGTLISVVDATGTHYTDKVISKWGDLLLLAGRGIHDAQGPQDDPNVFVTGSSGPGFCAQGGSSNVFLMRIEPLTMTISFLKEYADDATSWGTSVTSSNVAGDNVYVTGFHSSKGALYLETDWGGNFVRSIAYPGTDADMGNSIVYNTTGGYPTYSGTHLDPSGPTFIIQNNYGYDCEPDMNLTAADLSYDIYDAYTTPTAIYDVTEILLEYDQDLLWEQRCSWPQKPASVSGTDNDPKFEVFPNPATVFLDVEMNSPPTKGTTLTVLDMTGKTVLAGSFGASKTARLNIESLPAGAYLLRVEGEAATHRRVFVKQ